MAFSSVSWSSGDIISLAKMTQINSNDLYLKDVADDVTGGSTLINSDIYDPDNNTNDNFSITIDGVAWDSWTTEGNKTALNENISALSGGVHTVEFVYDGPTKTYRFWKSDWMDYLHAWINFNESVDISYTINISVLGTSATL